MSRHEIDADYEAWLDQQIADATAHQQAWADLIESELRDREAAANTPLTPIEEPIPLDWEEQQPGYCPF